MFETKILRCIELSKLQAQASTLGLQGWRIMTGWYGSNAHFLALQRSAPKYTGVTPPMIPAPKPAQEKPRGQKNNKVRGGRVKKSAADSSAK